MPKKSSTSPLLKNTKTYNVLQLTLFALCFTLVGATLSFITFAAPRKSLAYTCSLSKDASTGALISSGSGFAADTQYQTQIYNYDASNIRIGSSGGGQVTTNSAGNFTYDNAFAETSGRYPMSWYASVYPNTTTLKYELYPIIGNRARLGTVLTTCSISV